MSIIHVNQIKTRLEGLFTSFIDISDQEKAKAEEKQNHFLTRSLSAYAIHYLSGAELKECASSVTDGGNDNGIDAIYLDEPQKRLYLIQSKWIKDGSGEPENGDIKKFVAGIRDLFNSRFSRFNSKIQAKQSQILKALGDPATRYEVVVAYTGSSVLANPSARDLDDLAKDMNDTSELLFITVLNQTALHNSLTISVAGEPISIQIILKSWGRKESPHEAYYGQFSGDQIVELWIKYRSRLFAKNLRGTLGETDVNTEMRQTLELNPDDFWYFNNGITIVAQSTTRTLAGGTSNDIGIFHCEDISIVNGAQTVSTIGKFGEANRALIQNVMLPLRIILRGDNQNFGEQVTRTNNRQNRIENRDFVTLDPEQTRIRTELAIDGIDYQIMRNESVIRTDIAFDLVEASTSLACASGAIRLATQLKREIGKLWEDTSKAPYKELFNASVPGLRVWRCVQTQRLIDKAIDSYSKRNKTKDFYAVTTHGNRVVATLVYDVLPVSKYINPDFDMTTILDEVMINKLVDQRVSIVAQTLDEQYPDSIIPTLFKNVKKCEHIATICRGKL